MYLEKPKRLIIKTDGVYFCHHTRFTFDIQKIIRAIQYKFLKYSLILFIISLEAISPSLHTLGSETM